MVPVATVPESERTMFDVIEPYYCYDLQAWLAHERVLRCGHTERVVACFACNHAGEYHAACKNCTDYPEREAATCSKRAIDNGFSGRA